MKKIAIFLTGAFFLVMMLTACGDNRAKNYTTLAEDFITMIFAENYDDAMDYIDATMQESITTDALAQIVSDTTLAYGAFTGVESTEEIDISEFIEAMDISESDASAINSLDCSIVVVTVAFESSEMNFYLFFDNVDREIIGINVYGQEEMEGSETASSEDDMRSTAREFLNAAFSGEFATAYDMMSETLQAEMTEDDLDALLDESTSLYGDFDAVGQILIDGDDVIAYVTFAQSEVNAYLTLDSEGKIVSFFTDTPH